MAVWCSICDVRGHSTSDCWYKPKTSTYNKYIKEIRKENGKLKKKYSLVPQHNRIPIEKRNTTRRSRSKSPTPQRKEEAVRPTNTKPKENYVKTKHTRKSPPKSPLHTVGEVEVVEIVKPSTSKYQNPTNTKCPECLKWSQRMSNSLHYQEVTMNENKRLIKTLTEETMRLNQLLKKAITERDSFKNLYEVNRK